MGLQDNPTCAAPEQGQAPDTALKTPYVPGASTDHADLTQELIRMTIMATRPGAGLIDDMTKDDNRRGPEPDETEQYHRLVRQLVNDGDHRARSASRHARRTLAEMAPGYVRQPVLVLHRPSMNDACPVCTRWNCDPSNCPPSFAPAPTAAAPARTAVAR